MIRYKGQLYKRIDESKYEIIEHNQGYLKLAEKRLETKAKALVETEVKKLERELGITIEIHSLSVDYMSVEARAYGESTRAFGSYLIANFKLENGKTVEFDFNKDDVKSIDSIIENVSLNEAATKAEIDKILAKIKRQFSKVNKEAMHNLEKYAHEVKAALSHFKNFEFTVQQKSISEFIVDSHLKDMQNSLSNSLMKKWAEIDRIRVIEDSSTGEINLYYNHYYRVDLQRVVSDYTQLEELLEKAKVSQSKANNRLEVEGKKVEAALHSIRGVTITKSEIPSEREPNIYGIWFTAEPGLKLFIKIEASAGRITKTLNSVYGSSWPVTDLKFSDIKSTIESIIKKVEERDARHAETSRILNERETLYKVLRVSFMKQLPHITSEITSFLKAQPYEFDSIKVEPTFFGNDELDDLNIFVTSGGKKVDLTPGLVNFNTFKMENEHSIADLSKFENELLYRINVNKSYLVKKVDKHSEAEFNHLVSQLESRLSHFTAIQYVKEANKKDFVKFSATGVDSLPPVLNSEINRKRLDVVVTYDATNKPVIEFYYTDKITSVEEVATIWTNTDKKIAKYLANLNKGIVVLHSTAKELMTSLSHIKGLNVREDKNNSSTNNWYNIYYEVPVDSSARRLLKETAYKGSVRLNATRDAKVEIAYSIEGSQKAATSASQVVSELTALVNKFRAEGAIQ